MIYNASYILFCLTDEISKIKLLKQIKRNYINITYSSLDKNLKKLINLDLIKKEKGNKECYYYLTERGKIIQKELNGIFGIVKGGM